MDTSGSYACPTCHESIEVFVDVLAGRRQQYTEDCPVCCRPNLLTVEVGGDGEIWVEATAES